LSKIFYNDTLRIITDAKESASNLGLGGDRMDRSGSRFTNHLDDNLVHLHKNLYLSHGDPLYYEKVIRYLDAESPEAHFKLGQKHHKEGNLPKALYHYQETLRTYPSPYYAEARKALRQLTGKSGERQEAVEPATARVTTAESRSPLITAVLIILLLLNILIISLYFGADSIFKTISKLKPWTVGKEVTYVTTDIPFLMYFSNVLPTSTVESAIHEQAVNLSQEHPKQNILIYGIASSLLTKGNQALPLLDESLISQAFVMAEYNASIDSGVKIRFLHAEMGSKRPLSSVGANLVRTALNRFIQDFGKPPGSLDQLLQDYPHNYLSFVPLEASTRSNAVSASYNGSGGWVYDAASDQIGSMFYPNDLQRTSLPYDPIHIRIVKNEHSMKLLTGSQVILQTKVGLGADQQTPEAHLQVLERVLNPQGSRQGVYGTAGLGLGKLAIHGTNDESSIGSNKSLGCIRLSNADINQLFALVPKGASVEITAENLATQNESIQRRLDLSELIPPAFHSINETSMNQTFHWLG
jgi:hypothetical protein